MCTLGMVLYYFLSFVLYCLFLFLELMKKLKTKREKFKLNSQIAFICVSAAVGVLVDGFTWPSAYAGE